MRQKLTRIFVVSLAVIVAGCTTDSSFETERNSEVLIEDLVRVDTAGTSEYAEETAQFLAPDKSFKDAGTVLFNGAPMKLFDTIYQNTNYSPLDSVSAQFDGTYQNIKVSGSSTFPAFEDSILVPEKVRITNLTASSTISIASGLTLRWLAGKTGTDSMTILIEQDQPTVVAIARYLPDMGSTLSPVSLEDFKPGPIRITLTRETLRTATTSDGRNVRLQAEAVEELNTTLTN